MSSMILGVVAAAGTVLPEARGVSCGFVWENTEKNLSIPCSIYRRS
jgi:hypothetical protein